MYELRDFFAAQLMMGKVNDFYSSAHRENIGTNDEPWLSQIGAKTLANWITTKIEYDEE